MVMCGRLRVDSVKRGKNQGVSLDMVLEVGNYKVAMLIARSPLHANVVSSD
jgi:hypothetical protein